MFWLSSRKEDKSSIKLKQENHVTFFICLLIEWCIGHGSLVLLRWLVQAKKKPKKFQKGRATQQKVKGERKPVASEKVIKEVSNMTWFIVLVIFFRIYFFFTHAQLLGELYSDREYLDKLMKDPGIFSDLSQLNM